MSLSFKEAKKRFLFIALMTTVIPLGLLVSKINHPSPLLSDWALEILWSLVSVAVWIMYFIFSYRTIKPKNKKKPISDSKENALLLFAIIISVISFLLFFQVIFSLDGSNATLIKHEFQTEIWLSIFLVSLITCIILWVKYDNCLLQKAKTIKPSNQVTPVSNPTSNSTAKPMSNNVPKPSDGEDALLVMAIIITVICGLFFLGSLKIGLENGVLGVAWLLGASIWLIPIIIMWVWHNNVKTRRINGGKIKKTNSPKSTSSYKNYEGNKMNYENESSGSKKLRELKNLLEDGVITLEEFKERKDKILKSDF